MPPNKTEQDTNPTPGHVASTDLFSGTGAEAIERSATLSPCRTYRYALWRRWGRGPYAMFIGLNPSTADETNDDPTIRQCIGFARSWGYEALCMTNLFAYRATQPADMKKDVEPVGTYNDHTLLSLAREAGVVVAAWGAHGTWLKRDEHVRFLLGRKLHYLRLTKDGHPGHPLYLPASLRPVEWVTPNVRR
jgi:hypothetical protein